MVSVADCSSEEYTLSNRIMQHKNIFSIGLFFPETGITVHVDLHSICHSLRILLA